MTGKLTYREGHGHTISVGVGTVKMKAGTTKSTIALNRTGRKLLARRGKLSVQLTISVTVDGQTSVVATRKLSIARASHGAGSRG